MAEGVAVIEIHVGHVIPGRMLRVDRSSPVTVRVRDFVIPYFCESGIGYTWLGDTFSVVAISDGAVFAINLKYGHDRGTPHDIALMIALAVACGLVDESRP
jgi:hypothetical protein